MSLLVWRYVNKEVMYRCKKCGQFTDWMNVDVNEHPFFAEKAGKKVYLIHATPNNAKWIPGPLSGPWLGRPEFCGGRVEEFDHRLEGDWVI